MAYTPFSNTGPTPSQTVGGMLSVIKTNIQVIRDLLASMGMVQGFAYSHSGGTTEFPDIMFFTRSAEIIKIVITYVTTALGNKVESKRAFWYSSDTGSNYFAIADENQKYIINYSYNADDVLISTIWSLS